MCFGCVRYVYIWQWCGVVWMGQQLRDQAAFYWEPEQEQATGYRNMRQVRSKNEKENQKFSKSEERKMGSGVEDRVTVFA